MNNLYKLIFLLFVTFLFITLQTTILSPKYLGSYYPDLNLILITYVSINFNFGIGLFITLLNGYLMDLFSGYFLGSFLVSRLVIFFVVSGSTRKFYFNSNYSKGSALFCVTIISWLLIWIIIKLKPNEIIYFSVTDILKQSFVNIAVGLFLFRMLDYINERISQ